jgi:hypothetical protein
MGNGDQTEQHTGHKQNNVSNAEVSLSGTLSKTLMVQIQCHRAQTAQLLSEK